MSEEQKTSPSFSSRYSKDQLHSLYTSDHKAFSDWMNMGPLNSYGNVVKKFDHPYYGDYQPLARIAKNLKVPLVLLADEKIAVSKDIQKKVSDVIIDLIPALSELSFEIIGDKVVNHGVNVMGSEEKNDDANSWLSEIVKYDRGASEYVDVDGGDEDVRARGRNKLFRIAFLCSPGLMSLFKEMSPEQVDECLDLVRKGNLPSQLISDEETVRLVEYGKWMAEKQGEEPRLPAKAAWIELVKKELSEGKINYDKISKKIEKIYATDEVVYDGGPRYNMVDIDDEEYGDKSDIPSLGWDDPGGIR